MQENTMLKPRQRGRPSWTNVTLVLLVTAVTLATSPVDDGKTTGTSDTHEEWTAPRQRFDVVIQPISTRIDTFNYSGELFLAVTIGYVPEELEAAPRWSMWVEEAGQTFELTGDFEYLDGEFQTQDNGDRHHDIRGSMGRLCHTGETSNDGCIPCPVESGCSLTVEVDLCDSSMTGFMHAHVQVTQEDGELFELLCVDGDGTESICHRLDEWLEMDMVTTPGTSSLCSP